LQDRAQSSKKDIKTKERRIHSKEEEYRNRKTKGGSKTTEERKEIV
jgi:hypothetical protein